MKETNMKLIKEISKTLLMTCPMNNDPLFCNHIFANTPIFYDQKNNIMRNILEEDGFKYFAEHISKIIDEANNPYHIFTFINKPYSLTWYKYCKDYMSNKDSALILREAWMKEEDPNQNVNVTKRELISYFKHSDKQHLMEPEEKEYFDKLSDDVILYRGVGINRCKYGLSWTDEKKVAEWFMNRFKEYYEDTDKKDSMCLLTCKAKKEWMLAYLDGRSEKEIVLDVYAAKRANVIKEVSP